MYTSEHTRRAVDLLSTSRSSELQNFAHRFHVASQNRCAAALLPSDEQLLWFCAPRAESNATRCLLAASTNEREESDAYGVLVP